MPEVEQEFHKSDEWLKYEDELLAVAERQAGGRGGISRQLALSQFWKDRQAEFEKYAKQYASLEADWKAAYRTWLLRWGSTPDCFNVPQECKDVLNAVARKAATELPGRDVSGDAEPWQLWLDFMRVREWGGFHHAGSPIACTEREWDAGVKDGRPLVQVRREQGYSLGDEWKEVYLRDKNGKLRRLSAKELKGKSSERLQKYYHWLQDGTIEHVFDTSARFCENLAARAFELEATVSERPSGGQGVPVTGSSMQPPAEKKRGRSTGAPKAHDCNNPADESIWVSCRHDWRADAAYALECPASLRPAKAARLDAIAILRRGAAEVVQHTQPQTLQELERCLLPEFLKYAEYVFDKMAEAKLNSQSHSGRSKAHQHWLRAKCLPAVIDDVCSPIVGQFPITVRYVAEIVGDVHRPEAMVRMRGALWTMCAHEVIPGSFTRNLENRLSLTLMEERIPRWDARIANTTPTGTNKTVGTGNKQLQQSAAARKPRFPDAKGIETPCTESSRCAWSR